MNEDIIIKVIALLVATFIGVAKLIKYDPLKEWKEDVRRDLDILSKIEKDHYLYNVVKASADISLLAIYSKDHKPWYSLSYIRNKLILGVFILIFSTTLFIMI
jgi:hypothetical protein